MDALQAVLELEKADDQYELNADEQERDLGAYERTYEDEHSWEQLQEDEFGRLLPISVLAQQRARRRRLLEAYKEARVQKGVIRYLQLVVDWSNASKVADFKPYRGGVICKILERFVREFFDQNPLSQLGIVAMKDGLAVRMSETSGSPEKHIQLLRDMANPSSTRFEAPKGSVSLQNALEEINGNLRNTPPYGHRECLIVMASLSTCDPGNIHETVARCKANKVRVSVVGLSAEVYICRHMAEVTGGTYNCALGEGHLEELVVGHVPPPPLTNESGACLMRVGFPAKSEEYAKREPIVKAWPSVRPGTTACPALLQGGHFTCPQCRASVMDLPAKCGVCGLVLLNAQHIARSYHHLFPVPPFDEVGTASGRVRAVKDGHKGAAGAGAGPGASEPMEVDEPRPSTSGRPGACFGCYRALGGTAVDEVILRCPQCRQFFCFECDQFIHDVLYTCPGCEHEARYLQAMGGVELAAGRGLGGLGEGAVGGQGGMDGAG